LGTLFLLPLRDGGFDLAKILLARDFAAQELPLQFFPKFFHVNHHFLTIARAQVRNQQKTAKAQQRTETLSVEFQFVSAKSLAPRGLQANQNPRVGFSLGELKPLFAKSGQKPRGARVLGELKLQNP
jgi:hypothetical protein